MPDLETIARQAGEAVRHEARARRLRSQRTPAAPRRGRVQFALATTVLLAIGAAVVLRGGTPPPLQIVEQPAGLTEPVAQDGVLPIPPVGTVIPAYLDDLTPVFVSHPSDGEVLVLDARDARNDRLLVFCQEAERFVDVLHHKNWSMWGDYAGGPTPTGLPAFPTSVEGDGSWVRVTGPMEPAPGRRERRGPTSLPNEPWCSYGAPAVPFGPDAVAHQAPDSPPTLAEEDVPTDRWVWATVTDDGSDIRLVRRTADGVVALAAAADGYPASDAEVISLGRRDIQVLAAAPLRDPESLPASILHDQTSLRATWSEADISGEPPALPDGATAVVVVLGGGDRSACRSLDDVAGVEIFAREAVVLLDADTLRSACPNPAGDPGWTAYTVAIPGVHADGVERAAYRQVDG